MVCRLIIISYRLRHQSHISPQIDIAGSLSHDAMLILEVQEWYVIYHNDDESVNRKSTEEKR